MSATTANPSGNFNEATTQRGRRGFATGKLLGKLITKMDRGFECFEDMALGRNLNDLLKRAADSTSVAVQKLATKTTMPFALAVNEGFAEEKEAAKSAPKSKAQLRRGPSGP